MEKYIYYPGCSLEKTAAPYDVSTRETFKLLDVSLPEIDGWNCCGATMSMAICDKSAAYLSARNLAIADKSGADIVIPCSACYLALKKAEKFMKYYSEVSGAVSAELSKEGLEYTGKAKPRHVLEIFYNDLREELKNSVKRPLKGLKAAAYYGCQITRPEGFDDIDRPESMDHIIADMGAEPVDFSAKTKCCAGMIAQTIKKTADPMIRDILYSAKKSGADVIVTACPLCMMNLESYQKSIGRQYRENLDIPVLYLTQLTGLALGAEKGALGIKGNFVSPEKALEKISGGA